MLRVRLFTPAVTVGPAAVVEDVALGNGIEPWPVDEVVARVERRRFEGPAVGGRAKLI